MKNGGDAYAILDDGSQVKQAFLKLGEHINYDLYSGVEILRGKTLELVVTFRGVPQNISKIAELNFQISFPTPERRVEIENIHIQK